MDKTIVVAVETYKKHELYHKRIKYTKKFKAHDENNQAKIGDAVKIRKLDRCPKINVGDWLRLLKWQLLSNILDMNPERREYDDSTIYSFGCR